MTLDNSGVTFFMWVVSAPTKVLTTRKRPFSLNLNVYRNAHHHLLDDAKKDFAEIIRPRLSLVPRLERIRLSYILYAPTAQLLDVNNVCCIVDKFFSDCLVSEGKLPDDNLNHVPLTAFGWGGIDRNNPRVDVVIETYDQPTPTE